MTRTGQSGADQIQPPLYEMDEATLQKRERLKTYIGSLGSLAVGFSGGVDSTLLMAVAAEALGEKAIAVMEVAPMIPAREVAEAEAFCKERGIRLLICRADVLADEEIRRNDKDRCYYCKRRIFSEILKVARDEGMEYVAEGSNMDDLGDYRPGMRAIAELKIVSPLREAGLYKKEIRAISKVMGLPTWNKPAYACLATRIPTDTPLSERALRMIEQAEDVLIDLGFPEERVRVHGDLARIEVAPEAIEKIALPAVREKIVAAFHAIGFRFVALDLQGYVTGNMNTIMS